MSGISAVLSRDEAPGADVGRLAAAMLQRLRHRGPDGAGTVAMKEAALGQCTLVATPEDIGLEPPIVCSVSGRRIVLDGRIDNRQALLDALQVRPRSICDAALVLEAYRRWGRQCAARLLGDYAFVIHDPRERLLFCARDFIGVRPLYYHCDRKFFRCASEIHALFADSNLARRANWSEVAKYVVWQHSEHRDTLYQDIQALPAAHYLVVTPERFELERYWQPEPNAKLAGLNDDAYAERFEEVFAEAVRSRLRASGKVALQVSGGTDSSSVACQAAALERAGKASASLVVAHLSYPGLSCDETYYSAAVANRWGLPQINCDALGEDVSCELAMIYGHPELYYDPRFCSLKTLYEAIARDGARVVLSGEGGDHLLRPTGMEWADDLRSGRWRKLLEETSVWGRPWSFGGWKRALRGGLYPHLPGWLRGAWSARRKPAHAPWLTAQYQQVVKSAIGPPPLSGQQAGDAATARLCAELYGPPVPFLLGVADRLAASSGCDLRHPFFDRRVFELLLALPHRQRYQMGQDKPKPVVRRAMRRLLPSEVHGRVESATYDGYVRRMLMERRGEGFKSLFASSRLVEAGVMPPAWAARLARGQGPREGSALLRSCNASAMEIWLRQL